MHSFAHWMMKKFKKTAKTQLEHREARIILAQTIRGSKRAEKMEKQIGKNRKTTTIYCKLFVDKWYQNSFKNMVRGCNLVHEEETYRFKDIT